MNYFATRRKRLVEAYACSGRWTRRARRLRWVRRVGWPCTPWPFARPQPGCRFAWHRALTRLFARVLRASRGWGLASHRVFSSVLCAARGQRVLRGTEWTLCAPIGCVALVARCVRFWRRAGLSDRRACAPNPCLHCARTCCSQRGPVRAVLRLSCESRGAARGGSSLGRWRCGSCVAVRLRLRSGSRGSAGYLVDPASSHMLVSKIKPCMSKYKRLIL